MKLLDSLGLIVECNKLKSYEEKAWVKNQLNFMNESDARDYSTRIADIFSGNLIAQQNEINILKLTYCEENKDKKIGIDNAEFLPYQLEDKIIELDTKYALRITKSIKKNDDHYGPLLVWIIGKVINTCIGSHQDNISLEKAGIWKNKIPNISKSVGTSDFHFKKRDFHNGNVVIGTQLCQLVHGRVLGLP